VFIRRSREFGFSLDEIRTLLRLGGPEKAARAIEFRTAEDIERAFAAIAADRLVPGAVGASMAQTPPAARSVRSPHIIICNISALNLAT
jgi:MerR family transcriptional regulator, mercuric resistance operon regulatory protein